MARQVLTVGGVVLAAAIAISCADRPGPLDPVALRWLGRDCSVGERGHVEAELRSAGEHAETTLLWAFRHGPPSERLDEIAVAAGNEYDEIAEALNAGLTYGLSAAEIASIRAVPRAGHVQDARDEFDRDYRAAALAGLGVLALPRGVALLRTVANDQNSRDSAIAILALKVAGQPAHP